MEDPNILDLHYSVFSEIQKILDNPSTMQSFLAVLPPDCSGEDILNSIEVEKGSYNMTPAKILLRNLGNKGFRASHLIQWFETMGLQKALIWLKTEESLNIICQPQKEVEVDEGCELLLTCTADSFPPPEYQWYKDDDPLLLQIDPVLSIKPVRLKDSGVYTCLVTKWDSTKNAYEWLYSDFSNVEVIPKGLHAIPPCQGPYPCIQNFVPKEETFSLSESFDPDKELSSSSQSNFHHEPKTTHSSQAAVSSKQDIITITKHPYVSGKIAQGMSVCLTCEAVSSSHPVNYQWFKNGRPLQGEKSSQLVLSNLFPDADTDERKWDYQCEVYNKIDRAFSQTAVVELDEVNDTTPYIAHQKYAFMIANDTYDHLEHLEKPAADVKDLADMLSSLGFKIFPFRNLNLTEMRNAFAFFCQTLIPGSYALFFFAGHGFELYGQTYLQPVDSSTGCVIVESMCSEYILQCMQDTKPAMNVLIIDACRKLPVNLSENNKPQFRFLPGKIFQAKMKNNTIYGYSTSFLCASHESDEETNSVFVKHLKKYITQNKCIQDILMMVQNDFARDPVARNIQFPVIKSTLAERRKLGDPIQESPISSMLSHIVDWCDIKREISSRSIEISNIKAIIMIEFRHHMEVFCNGMDVYVSLYVQPNAETFILQDMEINISFVMPELIVIPTDGVALKNVGLELGRRNFLFKKEVFNIQKISAENLKYTISLKFCSKNVIKDIDCSVDAIKISELQLSLNKLAANNIEEPLLDRSKITIRNEFS